MYLTTKVALLFAVLEVGHRFQLVLRCVKHRVIRIIAISIAAVGTRIRWPTHISPETAR